MNHVGDVVSMAHLLRENLLPTKEQVNNFPLCCTWDEFGGERAMLITGCKDSLSGAHEKKKVQKCEETFYINLGEKEIIQTNLQTGVISFPSTVSAVSESIALGFSQSVAVLHLLCQPNAPKGTTVRYVMPSAIAPNQRCYFYNPGIIKDEKLKLVVAAGF